jgi:uncharacterized membrane protein YkvA (DUF1232 family)
MSDGPLGFGQRVASLPALVRDTLNGRYDGLGKGRLAMMVVALIYIVAPIDIVPEAFLTIPVLMDDAAVAAWLIASLMGATTAYRAWSDPLGTPSSWTPDLGAPAGDTPTSTAPRVVVGEVVSH